MFDERQERVIGVPRMTVNVPSGGFNVGEEPAGSWTIDNFDHTMLQGAAPRVGPNVNKVYVIQVMSTTCGVCSADIPVLEGMMADDLSGVPARMLLVSVDQNEEAIQAHARDNTLTMPIAWDPDGTFARRMKWHLLPKYLVLRGNVVYPFDFQRPLGQSDEYFEDLRWFLRTVACGPEQRSSPKPQSSTARPESTSGF